MLLTRTRPNKTNSRWLRIECGGEDFDPASAVRAAASARVTHLGLACRHPGSRDCRALEGALRSVAARRGLAFAAPRIEA